MKPKNLWVDRFDGLTTREAIRRRATVGVTPVKESVASCGVTEGKDAVSAALKSFHFVNEQELDLLERAVGLAIAHCRSAYLSVGDFAGTLQQERISLNVPMPICLSALNGGGKSTFIDTLARVMPDDDVLELGHPFRTPFRLRAFQFSRVGPRTALSTVLDPFMPADSRPRWVTDDQGNQRLVKPKISTDTRIELAQRLGYREGRAMNGLDELQFTTQSAGASTKLANTVMTVNSLGAPLIYALNFSGVNRLLGRRPEERDRLLTDPVVFLPDMPDSEDGKKLLAQFDLCLKEIRAFSLVDEAGEIFNMTVNVKRKIRELLELTYVEMRRQRATKMTMDHVKAAYKSKSYGEHRSQVKTIFEQAMAGKPEPGVSADLWCPLPGDYNRLLPIVAQAKANKDKRVLVTLTRQQLTTHDRAGLAKLLGSPGGRTAGAGEGAKVVPLRSRAKPVIDAAALLANTLQHKRDGDTPRT